MIECRRHNMSFLRPDTCIKRQTAIAEGDAILAQSGKKLSGTLVQVYGKYKAYCDGCKTGLKYYQKSLNGEEITMEKPETKICPCGKEFARLPDQNDISWNRTKYCPEHAAMNQYQRGKDLEQIQAGKMAESLTEKVNKTQAKAGESEGTVGEPPPVDEYIQAPKDEAGSTGAQILDTMPEDSLEYKFCAWEECGKIFYRGEGERGITWASRRYCDSNCRRDADKEREKKRSRLRNKRRAENKALMGFDSGRALEIAQTVIGEEIAYLERIKVDITDKDLTRGLAERACVEVCRRVMGAA